ncbi:MAG TPA: hypothetical protein VIV06_04520 [Candidatus Limnocylindrales bacterium]
MALSADFIARNGVAGRGERRGSDAILVAASLRVRLARARTTGRRAPPSPLTWRPSNAMAKRSRGSNRPGQRPSRPAQRPPARPSTAPRPTTSTASAVRPESITAAEEARAAELEAAILAEERAAEAGRARNRDRARAAEPGGRQRPTSILATRGVEEYAYVVRDVRRIATVGGGLLVVLVVLYLLIEVAKVVTF